MRKNTTASRSNKGSSKIEPMHGAIKSLRGDTLHAVTAGAARGEPLSPLPGICPGDDPKTKDE